VSDSGGVQMRRRRGSIAVALLAAAVIAPVASAQAATYSVAAGGGTCGGGDTACGRISDAAVAAGAGDTVEIASGSYNESPAFAAPGVTVRGSGAAPGVGVTGTITFSGNGGSPSVLERVVIATTAAGAPAVGVNGSAGVQVRDAVLLSTAGPGMAIARGANAITRSSVASGAAGGRAVDVQLNADPASLVIESSVLSGGGGADAAGLSVRTGIAQIPIPGSFGSATVDARHVTIAGSASAIVLDSSAATGLALAPPVGNIAAIVTDSIVLGATSTKRNEGLLAPVIGPNTASLSLQRTEQASVPDALFVSASRRNFHIRADAAAVIDKGQMTPGESDRDVDGQPRTVGPASDLGGDEFLNAAPTAAIVAKPATARTGQAVVFDGSGSGDREGNAGGGIKSYRWVFGDGSIETTSSPTVRHAYKKEGDVLAQLVVVDRQGTASAPASAAVKIIDGTPPAVVVAKPRNGQTLRLTRTTARTVNGKGKKSGKVRTVKRRQISFVGSAMDKSGVKAVFITIEKLRSKNSKVKQCTWLDPKRSLVKRACDKPVLIRPRFVKPLWGYNANKQRVQLTAGRYRVRAYGLDGAGAYGNSAPKNTTIRFTLKK